MPVDTLQTLARWLGSAFQPALDTGENPTESLLNALGWELPPGVPDIGLPGLNPGHLFDLIAALDVRVGSDESPLSFQLHADLAVELQAFLGRARNFSNNL